MSTKKLLAMLVVPAFALGMTACNVEETEEGDMPDVQVEDGQLPEYDVEPADVDVNQDTVTVPDVDVEEPQTEGGM